ncbi:SSI family serine proteinase inhibitor [Streptomyces sp. enrichment culture]|uniref:SSI family serine proteinase inhibitor n=1 Tax=Streptomyces sp. enrichment culture TaxID=1795815 RepID=UPI003F543D28
MSQVITQGTALHGPAAAPAHGPTSAVLPHAPARGSAAGPGARHAARGALRRFVTAVAVVSAALATVSAAPAAASATPTTPLGPTASARGEDRLTVTVSGMGSGVDGTYEVTCRPGRGSHPDPEGACAAVERNTGWGRDAFAPPRQDAMCTMQYGGPATAHVTGSWAGRPVEATYDRRNGCAIDRWDALVPLLPAAGSGTGSATGSATPW